MNTIELFGKKIDSFKAGKEAKEKKLEKKLKDLEAKVEGLQERAVALDGKAQTISDETAILHAKTSTIEKKNNQLIEETKTLFKYFDQKIKKLFSLVKNLFYRNKKTEKKVHKNTLLLDCAYSQNPLIKKVISMKQVLNKYEKDLAKGHEKFEEKIWEHFQRTNDQIQGVGDIINLKEFYSKFRQDFFGELNWKLQYINKSLVDCEDEYGSMTLRSEGGYHNAEALKNLGIDKEYLDDLNHRATKLQADLINYVNQGIPKGVLSKIDAFQHQEKKNEAELIKLEGLKKEFFELASQFDDYYVGPEVSRTFNLDPWDYSADLNHKAMKILEHECADEELKERVREASKKANKMLKEVEKYSSKNYQPRMGQSSFPVAKSLKYFNPVTVKEHKALLERELQLLESQEELAKSDFQEKSQNIKSKIEESGANNSYAFRVYGVDAQIESETSKLRALEKEHANEERTYNRDKAFLKSRLKELEEISSDFEKYNNYLQRIGTLENNLIDLESDQESLTKDLKDLAPKVKAARKSALENRPNVEAAQKELNQINQAIMKQKSQNRYSQKDIELKKNKLNRERRSLDLAVSLLNEYKEKNTKLRNTEQEIAKNSTELSRLKNEKDKFAIKLRVYAEEYESLASKKAA